ncbi:YkgJ family cysteine cluster protein [Archangium violaceum]|uniref:YkgJ family cysteine cluster protein n=1 Tax=Archangium violaceum TaxID=83451 RepID=UPI001950E1F2|nr:YkgJ family cysteine cluster protein [Archangium violaceum]QRN95359.1 YkgJ family cysteine cluster protein [Archangium violaceum]
MSLSELCRRCGLCCDGNLFSHVPLQGSEVEAARRTGLDVVALADGSPAVRQGCTALKDRRCSVYAERPEGCRRYDCRLFNELAGKRVSFEEALAVVAQAHALLSAVERVLGPDTDPRPSSVLERARFADWGEDGGSSSETRAARESAEAFLDRHFHGGPRRFEG